MKTLPTLCALTILLGLSFCTTLSPNHHLNEHLPLVTRNLVDEVNSRRTTWKASADQGSFIAGLTRSQAKSLMGVLLSESQFTSNLAGKPPMEIAASDLPTDFDARDKWSYCASLFQIRDQANCGSCWAVSTAAAVSDRTCIATKQNVTLSSQQITSCCDECGEGCNGGIPYQAWEYWVRDGVVSEECSPYALPSCDHHLANSTNPCPAPAPTPKCETTCSDSEHWKESLHFGKKAYQLPPQDFDTIMQDIYTYGSITSQFSVYEDFLTYKSGVYQHVTGEFLGGHAVKVFGWGVDKDTTTPYWLVANSWNTHWGDHGTFKIRRGSNDCGFEEVMIAGTA